MVDAINRHGKLTINSAEFYLITPIGTAEYKCKQHSKSLYVKVKLPDTLTTGPRLWNSLPVQLCNPDNTYGLFRRQLKSHLFGEA